jgi:hypothetical protein
VTQELVSGLGIIATLVVAVLLFKGVDRATRPKYKVVIRMGALMLGSFAAAAAAKVSIPLVVESMNKPHPALVRGVRAVPVEPDAEEPQAPVPEPEFRASPLAPSRPPPRQERPSSRVVVELAPPTEIRKPTEEPKPTTLNVHRHEPDHELQAP